MNLIRRFLLAALVLLIPFAHAQSTSNTPPTPGNNTPPVTCGTGQLPPGCPVLHGYQLHNCPNIRIEGIGGSDAGSASELRPPFTQLACGSLFGPVAPYILCWKFSNYFECEGYPSGDSDLVFSWNAEGVALTPLTADGRRVKLVCQKNVPVRLNLFLLNPRSNSLTADFANLTCTTAQTRG